MTDIAKSILAIKSDAQVTIWDEDIDNIIWHDDNPTNVTTEEILAKQVELQTEYDAQEYARNRAPLYPAIGDQLDMLWHAIDTGDWTAAKVKTTDFYTNLKKVKDDNSKPS